MRFSTIATVVLGGLAAIATATAVPVSDPEEMEEIHELEGRGITDRLLNGHDLSKKPLLDIAKCTGYTWDMIKTWCECVDNCDEQRAYWRGLVKNAQPDPRFVSQMMAGLESKKKAHNEKKVKLEIKKHMACDQYNQFQGRQMRVETEMIVAGLYTCKDKKD